MNFFKTVFSADPEPSDPENEEDDQDQEEVVEAAASSEIPKPHANASSPSLIRGGRGGGGGGVWSFGGLIKTIASRSETVIETYRRDLEEFSSGLKKETSVFKEVASRAVRDLPGSLEIGASVAQESLESVGQAIDDFGGSVWRGTAEIISHGKEALLAVDSDSSSVDQNSMEGNSQGINSSRRYSRFEVQVLAIQNDANTFVEEPDDVEDFEKWRPGFELEEKEEEIEGLLYNNGTLEGYFEKFVPDIVDGETFWARYFYRVYRLKQAEDARAKLVKRVIAGEEEEELSWEVDDSDESEEEIKDEKKEEGENVLEKAVVGALQPNEEKPIEGAEKEEMVENLKKLEDPKVEIVKTSDKTKEEVVKEELVENPKFMEEKKLAEIPQVENVEEVENIKSQGNDDATLKTEGKVPLEPKSDLAESSKDSDFSVISSQPSMQEEEDLEWDEIEDLGEHEDKDKILGGLSGSPKKVDLRQRLSVPEDDEDLSWDIEDDD